MKEPIGIEIDNPDCSEKGWFLKELIEKGEIVYEENGC